MAAPRNEIKMGKISQNGKPVPDVLKFKPKNNKPGISRDEARSKEKKRLNRMRKLARLGLSLFLILCVAALGTVFAFTVFFKTETITVNGSTAYPPDTVIEKSGMSVGSNLFGSSSKKIAERLTSQLPYIGSVSVERKLPSTLIINITETTEAAAIAHEGSYVLIAPDGKILSADAILTREDIPVVNGVTVVSPEAGKQVVFETETVTSQEAVPSSAEGEEETKTTVTVIDRGAVLLRILATADKCGLKGLTDIDLQNCDAITMKYAGRITVKLGGETNLETKIKRTKAAIDSVDETNKYSVGVLDLTVEPYTYFRSGADTPRKTNAKNTKKTDTSKKQKQ